MAIDLYQPCPCGSGKKLKFCCRDVAAEIEKIDRMLRGEQYAAALKELRALTAKHPDRPSLECMRAMVEMHEENFDEARQVLNQLIVKHPDSCRAWAELAFLESVTNGGRAAVEPLQKALEAASSEVPLRLYYAIASVAMALLQEGMPLAARAHILLQVDMSPEDDTQPQQMAMQLNASQEIPLLFKEEPYFAEPPADAPWKAEYQSAVQKAFSGRWREAQRSFLALAQRYNDHPEMWRYVAQMRANLADNVGAVEALRKYARATVPLEDAVEAEALAQFLDVTTDADMVTDISQPRMILDKDALEATLLSDDRIERLPDQLMSVAEQDGPPPLAMFVLLDKPVPRSADGLTLDTLPRLLGTLSLYGRETDREARLEILASDDHVAQVHAILDEIAGSHLAEPGEKQVRGQSSRLVALLRFDFRLPDDATVQQRNQMFAEETRRVLFREWPEIPRGILGGKTPRAAAADPAQKIAVLAEILRLETGMASANLDFDFNELRRELALPERGPFEADAAGTGSMPLSRLSRLNLETCDDDLLIAYYFRALIFQASDAIERLGHELLRRESCHEKLDVSNIYGVLASRQKDEARLFEYLAKAQQMADARGNSSARWDLAELRQRMAFGHVKEAQAVMQHIRRHHMEEPGIAESLFRLLVDLGVIDPSGMPAGPPPSGMQNLGAAAPAGGAIWTPEGAAGTEEKSKLWVPGMD